MAANKDIKRKSPQIQIQSKSPKLQKSTKSPHINKIKTHETPSSKLTSTKQQIPLELKQNEDDDILYLHIDDDQLKLIEQEETDAEESMDSAQETNINEKCGVIEDEKIEVEIAKPKIAKVKKEFEDPLCGFVVFVGNLNFKTTEEEIRLYFEQAGEVDGVRIITCKSNRSRGFAFVKFKRNTAYKKALTLNKTSLAGRDINVEVTKIKSLEELKHKYRTHHTHNSQNSVKLQRKK